MTDAAERRRWLLEKAFAATGELQAALELAARCEAFVMQGQVPWNLLEDQRDDAERQEITYEGDDDRGVLVDLRAANEDDEDAPAPAAGGARDDESERRSPELTPLQRAIVDAVRAINVANDCQGAPPPEISKYTDQPLPDLHPRLKRLIKLGHLVREQVGRRRYRYYTRDTKPLGGPREYTDPSTGSGQAPSTGSTPSPAPPPSGKVVRKKALAHARELIGRGASDRELRAAGLTDSEILSARVHAAIDGGHAVTKCPPAYVGAVEGGDRLPQPDREDPFPGDWKKQRDLNARQKGLPPRSTGSGQAGSE